MSGPERDHLLEQVLVLDSAKRPARDRIKARTGSDHVVELRSWSADVGLGMIVVEAACEHLILRCLWVGCQRSLADHHAEEVADLLDESSAEHAKACSDRRPSVCQVVKV